MTRGRHVYPKHYFFIRWGTWQTFGFPLYEAIRLNLFARLQRRTMAMPRWLS